MVHMGQVSSDIPELNRILPCDASTEGDVAVRASPFKHEKARDLSAAGFSKLDGIGNRRN
tara:strand:+ start:1113 stop:1292 length:180 start_codon:yes stop_codon:yes gene_type:complete